MIYFLLGVIDQEQASLKEIVSGLQACYCNTIGFETEYIDDDAQRLWLYLCQSPKKAGLMMRKRLLKKVLLQQV